MDAAQSWGMVDVARDPDNVAGTYLLANTTGIEVDGASVDIVTGGLKCRKVGFWNSPYTFIHLTIGTPVIDTDGRIIAGR